MTVREVISVIADTKRINVGYGGGCTEFNPKSIIMAEAYGDYVVAGLYATEEGCFEIDIAVRPIKEGEDR